MQQSCHSGIHSTTHPLISFVFERIQTMFNKTTLIDGKGNSIKGPTIHAGKAKQKKPKRTTK